ncbi:O-antigen ligase family protein [Pseudenterobacter timonensis]|uniref:O-antigen ligase family protein n=1 Tax=Pseudenterobacter timonensis TaxID=1755099 RepID=A0ABV4A200_9ENTR
MSINKKIVYSIGDYSYSLLIVLMLLGYPIFSILASVLDADLLTLFYRGLCILFGFIGMVFASSSLKNNLSYTKIQIIIIGLHLIYICWVFIYFSNGYKNENLDLSFYINNSIIFSLLPILLVNRNINENFYPLLKKQIRFTIVLFIVITFLAYKLGLSDEYRLSFEKINPISLSLYAAVAILLSFWVFKSKVILVVIVFILLTMMLLSGSRGPLVALAFVTSCLIFFRMKFLKKVTSVAIGFIVAFTVFYLYDIAVNYIPILSRFNFNTTEGGMSVNIREEQYRSALSIFSEHPFFGGSLVEHYAQFYPHNIILEILITGGVALFCIYLFVFFAIGVELQNSLKNRVPVCFYLIFCTLFVSYMFTSSLAGIGLMYFTVVIISRMNQGITHDKYNYH